MTIVAYMVCRSIDKDGIRGTMRFQIRTFRCLLLATCLVSLGTLVLLLGPAAYTDLAASSGRFSAQLTGYGTVLWGGLVGDASAVPRYSIQQPLPFCNTEGNFRGNDTRIR